MSVEWNVKLNQSINKSINQSVSSSLAASTQHAQTACRPAWGTENSEVENAIPAKLQEWKMRETAYCWIVSYDIRVCLIISNTRLQFKQRHRLFITEEKHRRPTRAKMNTRATYCQTDSSLCREHKTTHYVAIKEQYNISACKTVMATCNECRHHADCCWWSKTIWDRFVLADNHYLSSFLL